MSIPVFWLACGILLALLYGIVILADRIWQAGTKSFIKRHLADEWAGPDACFECDRTDCSGCEWRV